MNRGAVSAGRAVRRWRDALAFFALGVCLWLAGCGEPASPANPLAAPATTENGVEDCARWIAELRAGDPSGLAPRALARIGWRAVRPLVALRDGDPDPAVRVRAVAALAAVQPMLPLSRRQRLALVTEPTTWALADVQDPAGALRRMAEQPQFAAIGRELLQRRLPKKTPFSYELLQSRLDGGWPQGLALGLGRVDVTAADPQFAFLGMRQIGPAEAAWFSFDDDLEPSVVEFGAQAAWIQRRGGAWLAADSQLRLEALVAQYDRQCALQLAAAAAGQPPPTNTDQSAHGAAAGRALIEGTAALRTATRQLDLRGDLLLAMDMETFAAVGARALDYYWGSWRYLCRDWQPEQLLAGVQDNLAWASYSGRCTDRGFRETLWIGLRKTVTLALNHPAPLTESAAATVAGIRSGAMHVVLPPTPDGVDAVLRLAIPSDSVARVGLRTPEENEKLGSVTMTLSTSSGGDGVLDRLFGHASRRQVLPPITGQPDPPVADLVGPVYAGIGTLEGQAIERWPRVARLGFGSEMEAQRYADHLALLVKQRGKQYLPARAIADDQLWGFEYTDLTLQLTAEPPAYFYGVAVVSNAVYLVRLASMGKGQERDRLQALTTVWRQAQALALQWSAAAPAGGDGKAPAAAAVPDPGWSVPSAPTWLLSASRHNPAIALAVDYDAQIDQLSAAAQSKQRQWMWEGLPLSGSTLFADLRPVRSWMWLVDTPQSTADAGRLRILVETEGGLPLVGVVEELWHCTPLRIGAWLHGWCTRIAPSKES